jgi:hypothetical protein
MKSDHARICGGFRRGDGGQFKSKVAQGGESPGASGRLEKRTTGNHVPTVDLMPKSRQRFSIFLPWQEDRPLIVQPSPLSIREVRMRMNMKSSKGKD